MKLEKIKWKGIELKKIKWKWVLGFIGIWLCVYVVGTGIGIWSYGEVDEKQKADVIIVLGAAVYGGEVSPVFKERLNHGIRLYEEGYATKMILTGGVGEGNGYSDAYIAKQYVVGQGVPEEAVLLEEKSVITQENIENAKIPGDCGISAYSSPTTTTRYQTMKSKLPFLLREEFFYIGYQIYRIIK